MDLNTVYTKTSKGAMEVAGKSRELSREQSRILTFIDGKSSVGEILDKAGRISQGKLEHVLGSLLSIGFIRVLKGSGQTHLAEDLGFSSTIIVDEANTQAFFEAQADVERRARRKKDEEKASTESDRGALLAELKAEREAQARVKEQAEAAAKATVEAEQKARQEAEAKAAAERQAKEDAERKAAAEAKARAEAEDRVRQQTDAKARAEAEAKEIARKETEANARAEAEARARAEAEARMREAEAVRRKVEEEKKLLARQLEEARLAAELESRAKRRLEARAREEEETRQRVEAEARAKLEEEARRRAQAEEKARAEAEARQRAEEAAKAQAEAQRKAREEAEARAAAEALARAEAEKRAREEAQARAKAEEQAKAQAEAERRAREEAEAKAAAERKAREEAEARAKAEEEARARVEVERKAHEEEAERQRAEAEAKARAEEEARVRAAEEARRRAEEEAAAKADAERRAQEEEAARRRAEAEARAREEAAAQARAEDEARKRAEEEAARQHAEAEARAREEAERQARAEEEAKARLKAEAERVEAEIKLAAERAEREEAEARARAEAEKEEAERRSRELAAERARAEAAAAAREEERLQAKAAAENYARMEAEEARRQAEEQERFLLDEEAREREEADVRAQTVAQAKTAEQAALERILGSGRSRGLGDLRKWARYSVIGLVGALVLAFLLAHIISFNFYAPQLEAQLAQVLGERVTIGSLSFSAFPSPQWRMERVTLGALNDIKISKAELQPQLSDWFSEVKHIKRASLEGVTADRDSLSKLPAWFARQTQAPLKFERIEIKQIKVDGVGINVPSFDARLDMSNGTLGRIVLTTLDRRATVEMEPMAGALKVHLQAQKWTPPLGLNLQFDQLDIQGMARGQVLELSSIFGALHGGSLKGSGQVSWGEAWKAAAEIELKRINLASVMGLFTGEIHAEGELEAKASISADSNSIAGLLAAPQVRATFLAKEGFLGNIDLVRAINAPARTTVSGGQTRFNDFSGYVQIAKGKYQYRQLRLTLGMLSATGAVDIDTNKTLSGTVASELKSKATTIKVPLSVSGTLATPTLRGISAPAPAKPKPAEASPGDAES